MPEVTITTDDLEALLMTAAVTAANPAARHEAIKDIQCNSVIERVPAAVDRAGRAWRKALRHEENPERYELTEADIEKLRMFSYQGASSHLGGEESYLNEGQYLMTKGLLETGVWFERIVWSNAGEKHYHHQVRRVRLTPEGVRVLEQNPPKPPVGWWGRFLNWVGL
jgi:hypothetical protein